MKKVVLCHFFNEEHLLPWWLKHHRKIFDHGIMIDYASTDRSVEIIREHCPTWEIRASRNSNFSPKEIDDEVMDIEKEISPGDWNNENRQAICGDAVWRICLNVTEFLYGNYDRLHDKKMNITQYILANYVFVDMEDPGKEPIHLSHDRALHNQRHWGYFAPDYPEPNPTPHLSPLRLNRSIHNFPLRYPDIGRHFTFKESDYMFDDLVIFYYGHADVSEPGLKRKMQIQTKIHGLGGHHVTDAERCLAQVRQDHKAWAQDLNERIGPIIEHHRRITGEDW